MPLQCGFAEFRVRIARIDFAQRRVGARRRRRCPSCARHPAASSRLPLPSAILRRLARSPLMATGLHQSASRIGPVRELAKFFGCRPSHPGWIAGGAISVFVLTAAWRHGLLAVGDQPGLQHIVLHVGAAGVVDLEQRIQRLLRYRRCRWPGWLRRASRRPASGWSGAGSAAPRASRSD